MGKARKRREEEDAAVDLATSQERRDVVRARIRGFLKALFGFLAPLSIFLPFKRPEGKGRDWNITFLVFGSMCAGLLMASALHARNFNL